MIRAHLMRGGRIASQSEAIRAVVSGGSPCGGGAGTWECGTRAWEPDSPSAPSAATAFWKATRALGWPATTLQPTAQSQTPPLLALLLQAILQEAHASACGAAVGRPAITAPTPRVMRCAARIQQRARVHRGLNEKWGREWGGTERGQRVWRHQAVGPLIRASLSAPASGSLSFWLVAATMPARASAGSPDTASIGEIFGDGMSCSAKPGTRFWHRAPCRTQPGGIRAIVLLREPHCTTV